MNLTIWQLPLTERTLAWNVNGSWPAATSSDWRLEALWAEPSTEETGTKSCSCRFSAPAAWAADGSVAGLELSELYAAQNFNNLIYNWPIIQKKGTLSQHPKSSSN